MTKKKNKIILASPDEWPKALSPPTVFALETPHGALKKVLAAHLEEGRLPVTMVAGSRARVDA